MGKKGKKKGPKPVAMSADEFFKQETKQKFQMITARYLSKWIHCQLIRIKIKLNPNRKHQLRLTLPHRKMLIKKMWIMLVFLEMKGIRECK